jgi:hypothetical protein
VSECPCCAGYVRRHGTIIICVDCGWGGGPEEESCYVQRLPLREWGAILAMVHAQWRAQQITNGEYNDLMSKYSLLQDFSI